MAIQKRLSKTGIAKQASKGSPETSAEYDFGVLGGTVVNADVSEDDLNPTADSRVKETRERTLVIPGADYEAPVMPKSVGRLLLAACGAVSTTGTGPYTHTFTESGDMPYHTLFARYGSEYYEVHDAKLDELAISWDNAGAAELAATYMGLDLAFDTGAYSSNTSERPNDALRGAGGSFLADGAAANVTEAEITVANNLEAVDLSDSVKADDVFPALQDVEVSLTLVPDNLDDWQKFLTGAVDGTSIANDPNFGSVDLTLSNAGGQSLQFTASEVAFEVAMPDADPEGGPAEVELEGIVTRPASGDPYQFVLDNGEASY